MTSTVRALRSRLRRTLAGALACTALLGVAPSVAGAMRRDDPSSDGRSNAAMHQVSGGDGRKNH